MNQNVPDHQRNAIPEGNNQFAGLRELYWRIHNPDAQWRPRDRSTLNFATYNLSRRDETVHTQLDELGVPICWKPISRFLSLVDIMQRAYEEELSAYNRNRAMLESCPMMKSLSSGFSASKTINMAVVWLLSQR
eukprot:scaffold669_cov77-Skeletonema_dohrnii-CCMP3373.AAC.2